MYLRILTAALVLSLAFALAACSPTGAPDADDPTPPEETEDMDATPAPGLYDLDDGTVRAVGTLERVDLEGGFWAVTDGVTAGDEGGAIAVIANGDELDEELSPLEGRMVSVTGERFEGMSIRMAGPEIVAETIEEMSDAPGATE